MAGDGSGGHLETTPSSGAPGGPGRTLLEGGGQPAGPDMKPAS